MCLRPGRPGRQWRLTPSMDLVGPALSPRLTARVSPGKNVQDRPAGRPDADRVPITPHTVVHGQLVDPFGHRGNISQRLRDVPHDKVVAGGRRALLLMRHRLPGGSGIRVPDVGPARWPSVTSTTAGVAPGRSSQSQSSLWAGGPVRRSISRKGSRRGLITLSARRPVRGECDRLSGVRSASLRVSKWTAMKEGPRW
jgi:hypothetical protein